MPQIISVGELAEYLKLSLDQDELLSNIMVRGEISNWKPNSSGNIYFSLKDEEASISCVMFRYEATSLRFLPENGLRVILSGQVSYYKVAGKLQIYCSEMQPDGVGSLSIAFEQLKRKLYEEGLFSEEHKKSLPVYPQKIALITSATGAAVQDMLRVLKKRFPVADVLVCAVPVQGDGAAEIMAEALNYLSERSKIELIILGRGGGSMEDLWEFNKEVLARAIYDCSIPIISAVGHEPDVTIADFVADLRAATPSNGAELAVPDRTELRSMLQNREEYLSGLALSAIALRKEEIARMRERLERQNPTTLLREHRIELDSLVHRLEGAMQKEQLLRRERLNGFAEKIEALGPENVLRRGYGMIFQEGESLTRASEARNGSEICIRFSDGMVYARVIRGETQLNSENAEE